MFALLLSSMFWCAGLHSEREVAAPCTYYVHPGIGSDSCSGISRAQPFRTLGRIGKLKLHPGDSIVLAAGQVFQGSLQLIGEDGDAQHYIVVTSENWGDGTPGGPASIDFEGFPEGILVRDCGYIRISGIALTGNGYGSIRDTSEMRCAVLVTNANREVMSNIELDGLAISGVYYERPGFVRAPEEVRSANGTQRYGWGIRIINCQKDHFIRKVTIRHCSIDNVEHTGIKFTGSDRNITRVNIQDNRVSYSGGPGIQLSEVDTVYVANNTVDHSGSNDDRRKWGRGSGLWTWGASNVLIEKNRFVHANGPGDSDGAHIDFNCHNVVIQYNVSAYNAGGFCEILGNNYNCIYRYNISVNDGYRVKGKDGAFQEGKTLWLSGYRGMRQGRKGPVNTYIYNNTIYTDASIRPNIAFDVTSEGVLIANNIFSLVHPFRMVPGDQYKPDVNGDATIKNMLLANNLFFNVDGWPPALKRYVSGQVIGDPLFKHAGGVNIPDYMPANPGVVKNKGVVLPDALKLLPGYPFRVEAATDIAGNPLPTQPSIGAIEP